MSRADDEAGPTGSPDLPRRIEIPLMTWIGMAIIAAIPLAAALGALGPTQAVATASVGAIELTVHYPSRCRYEMVEPIQISVRNRTEAAIERVTVSVDPAYMGGFAQAQFVPDMARAFEVDVDHLLPGETRVITGEMQGERYGRFSGDISAKAGSDAATARVSTFIFP